MRIIYYLSSLLLITALSTALSISVDNIAADTQLNDGKVPSVLTHAVFDEISAGKTPVIRDSGDMYIMDELPYYHLIADKDVESGIIYESENQQLSLAPVRMIYDDGTVFKTAPYEVDAVKHWDGVDFGQLVEGRPGENAVGMYYPNAFGIGNHIGILTHRYKLKEIESMAYKPIIPETTKTLDIWFEISGDLPIDWDYKTDLEITDSIQLGENSWLNPAKAWDSKREWNESLRGFDENVISISSRLTVKDGMYYYIKSIPTDWLKKAQYPIYTDADITWGAADEFTSTANRPPAVCRVNGSTTRFGVGYSNHTTKALYARVGEWDGGTGIDWGAESSIGVTMYVGYAASICSPSSDVLVITYQNSSEDWYAIAGDLTGTTINGWGSATLIDGGGFRYETGICPGDTDEFVAFSEANVGYDSRYIHGAHCTLSGVPKTTITVNDTRRLVTTVYRVPLATQIDTDKWVMAGGDNSDYMRAAVVSWDGSELSIGSPIVLDQPADAQLKATAGIDSPFLNFGVTDKAIVAYMHYGGYGYAVALTASGTTLSMSPAIYEYSSGRPSFTGVAMCDTDKFVLTYYNPNSSSKLYSRYNSVNWTTRVISSGSEEEVDSSACAGAQATYLQPGLVVTVYERNSDTSGQAKIGDTETASSVPDVTTTSITNAGTSTAYASGNITAINGGTPTERGFCYVPCASGTPDYSDSKEYEVWSSGTGSYSLTIDSLTCGTCYNIRAYAVTTSGTGYGSVLSVTTVPGSGCYTTDRLYLEFEPDQISSGTISDQSSYDNFVTYTLGDMPSGVSVTLSDMVFQGAIAPWGQEQPKTAVVGIVGDIDYPTYDDMYYVGDSPPGEDIPIQPYVQTFADMLDVSVAFFWYGFSFMLATLIGTIAWLTSRKSIPTAIITGAVLILCFSMGGNLIPFWTIIIYGFCATALITFERVYSW